MGYKRWQIVGWLQWDNCLIKKTPKIQKTNCVTEIKLKTPQIVTRSLTMWRAWYKGSYLMMAKPMKTLELHYPMISIKASMGFGTGCAILF